MDIMYKYSLKPWKNAETNSTSMKSFNSDFICNNLSSEKSETNDETTRESSMRTTDSNTTKCTGSIKITNSNEELNNIKHDERLTDNLNKNSDDSSVDGLKMTSKATSSSSIWGTPSTSPTQGKGVSAKDKRKLREKRRSTGVARINEIFGDETRDTETDVNTTINECIVEEEDCLQTNTNSVTQKSSFNHTSTNSLILNHQDTSHSNDSDVSSLGITNSASGSSYTGKSCLKKPPPTVSLKPAVLRNSSGGKPVPSCNSSVQSGSVEVCKNAEKSRVENKTSAEADLRISALEKRIQQLEMRLSEEETKNSLLSELVAKRDCRIEELLQEVEALNQDLDLADEEFEKLETENRVILRSLADLQINSS